MLEVRAEKLRREVLAVAGSGAGVTQLHERALELVGETVRSDLTCWAMLDPETLAISSMTSGRSRIPQQYEPLLAESEYNGDDPGTFAELARSGRTVARASDLPADEVAHSLRHGAVWAPLGLGSEVRIVFRVDGVCWGAAGLVRSGPDFTDRELEFLTLVAPGLAVATRAASVHAPAISGGGDQGPAVVLTDAAGDPVALTAAARGWQDRFDEVAPGRLTVVLRAATFGARSSGSGIFKARVRDAEGGWILVRATALIGGDEPQTVVTLEPAVGGELTGLLLAAYAVTARERDVCADVIAGYATSEIAGRRGITVNTVQDHLKSVYAKAGVRSRAELAARLRTGREH
ncbi:LuxR C-terminal-related transcriptional regulator [Rhodococcus opacus]|uniref:LuxR C-terminal-related transcriptional regulator n=1 Tax=Rhodococcus opacus TaxID=37919 RepID=UPI0005652353|nr:LuxR C-terminal-related transcriptional regulator [Rhodococcus opacus]UDG99475.1 LuxR C-terminal-related transcriptional regulator [Rhodococcus opacus PD630]